ncbi:hypothetical protein SAMN05878276_0736 [Aquipseudomonas alcaligenes]|uniref:hypothetical protein n=1 Tax=Aquipseudomonas alcaligenes TaxID=43263 RepID=UPI0009552F0B|nr:hypothetical protein [Pseudomonas alcaligenes]SIR86751.1 hypothetical protein SAMN05878276_0736 [Pseudomonas alcaligenes]
MSRIVLHIDRLLLRGIHSSDAEAFATALRAELHQMLVESGGQSLLGTGHRASYRPPAVRVQERANAAELARAVAPHVLPGSPGGES